MKLGFLIVFILWYGLISLFYVSVDSSKLDGSSANYNFTDDLNTSGFTQDEIDTGGFFSGLIGVGASIGRFFGFVLFGLFLPVSAPSWVSVLISFLNTGVTALLIGWIISIFWDG